MSKRWKCAECSHICGSDGLLEAPNPFDPEDIVYGCSECKAINSYEAACDEPGCDKSAGCGWPTADGGYRHTCGQHWKREFP